VAKPAEKKPKEEKSKGKKRQRDEPDEAPQLVDTSTEISLDKGPEVDLSTLTKSQRKKLLKKQKLNSGEAAKPNGTADKKVQFDKKLEKGPTPGTGEGKAPVKPALSPQAKVEHKATQTTLPNGIVIVEHKLGTGAKAKSGTKIGVRYIGKLVKTGKEFDKNTKGAPYRFVLGKGEVIKGTRCARWG
jgi:FK506-binding nuclear protein